MEIELKTPEPFVVITGEQHIATEKINNFFEDVLNFIGFDQSATNAFVERKKMVLGIEDPGKFRPSDDQLTLLIIRDLTVASALERRNDFNLIEVSCAHYLTTKRLNRLRNGINWSAG